MSADENYMEPLDLRLLPHPFGLNNTGAICYWNSILQLLAGCSAFLRAVTDNAALVEQTRTGRAMLDFVTDFIGPRAPARGIAYRSADLLAALQSDLRQRRPRTQFGAGQQSAEEALNLLLQMIEPPMPNDEVGPIARLFTHRFICLTQCDECNYSTLSPEDEAVCLDLFHFDKLDPPPRDPEAFSKNLRLHKSSADDYDCPVCKKKTSIRRSYKLSMIPEILICRFNRYDAFGDDRVNHYFPRVFELPRLGGPGGYIFRLVGQVEHAGSRSSGHYWTRGLRAGGVAHTLNDTSVWPSTLAPTAGTYLVAYHYAATRP